MKGAKRVTRRGVDGVDGKRDVASHSSFFLFPLPIIRIIDQPSLL